MGSKKKAFGAFSPPCGDENPGRGLLMRNMKEANSEVRFLKFSDAFVKVVTGVPSILWGGKYFDKDGHRLRFCLFFGGAITCLELEDVTVRTSCRLPKCLPKDFLPPDQQTAYT